MRRTLFIGDRWKPRTWCARQASGRSRDRASGLPRSARSNVELAVGDLDGIAADTRADDLTPVEVHLKAYQARPAHLEALLDDEVMAARRRAVEATYRADQS